MLCLMASAKAQIELEEAKVFLRISTENIADGVDQYTLGIREEFSGEFMKDPLAFMNKNFSIHSFIDIINKKHDGYSVVFRNKKGALNAEFDGKGNLLSNRQDFTNLFLPREIIYSLYRNHQGWSIVQTRYRANGKKDQIDRAYYKVKLANGRKSRNLRIDAGPKQTGVVFHK